MTPFLGRWARWGWLATTVLMAVALLATAWVGRQRAAAAADTVDRGQGEVMMEAARQALRGAELPADRARLDSLLAQQRGAGLRYAGVLLPPESTLAEAGSPVGAFPPPPDSTPRPLLTMTRVNGRVRMVTIARLGQGPPRQAPPGDGVQSGARPEDRPAGPPRARPRFPLLVIEFEPVVAERLAAEATRIFALSALVAAALLGVALLFWRLTVRQQLIERHLEQQRRLGMLGEMSAVLAHEIRNPLASLKGHAQLLAERLGAESAEGRKAELVVQEARRLEALTGDLLDFARSGPIDIRPADPAELARASVAEVGAEGFVLRTDAAPPTWPLDGLRLRQALTNVLRNARQASPEGTRPEVTVGREGSALVIAVRDFGPGIPAGEERRIFSPFYTTRTQGTGLGLAVALRVAEMHEGTITVANHPEGGAVFRIVLPGG
jgi:two-component system, NtrC family, sensor histidine kinase HydH